MNNAKENTFVTPNHELEISYTTENLKIHAKLKKGKILGSVYLSLTILTFLMGLLTLFIASNSLNPLLFAFTYNRIAFGLISLFCSYLICIGLFKLHFRYYRNKRLGFFDQNLLSYNILLGGFLPLIEPISNLFLGNFVFEYYTPFLFLFSSWNFVGYTTYKLRNVDITAHKNNSLLQIEGIHILPLSFFDLSFLTVKHKMFSINPPGFILTIMHHDKQAVKKKIEVKGRMLLQYQYLSIEEARNKAEENNCFILSLTDNKIKFGSNFGAIIGTNFSIGLIEEILQFLNSFYPSSIIKLDNKTEGEFTKFAIEHPLGPSKKTRNIILVFLLLIIGPFYILTLVISLGLIYLIIMLPGFNEKAILFLLFLMTLVIILLPFFMFKSIRNAKDKERSLLDRFDIVQK